MPPSAIGIPLLPLVLVALPFTVGAQGPEEFLAVRAMYGNLNTIAGTGATDSCDDWNPAAEGGPATGAGADLSRPHMAMADADGFVYIADKEGSAIRRVGPDGTITTRAGNGTRGDSGDSGVATEMSLLDPNGLFTQPDGTTYILDLNEPCAPVGGEAGATIRRVGTDGTMTTLFEDPACLAGRGLWVSPDASLVYYCSGTLLRKWTPEGGIETLAGGFSELGNLDREPDGNLLVTDRFGHRVWRVGPDGTKTAIAGNGGTSGGGNGQPALNTGLNEVRGVARLPGLGYFLCTHRGSQVWYVDTAGYIWLFIDGNRNDAHAGDGQPIATPGQKISEPRAITLAPNGDLLITEHDSGFVRRVTNTTVKPVLTIAAITGDGDFLLRWTSHREAAYLVEKTADFIDWSPVATVPASNGPTTDFRDPLAPDGTFYRLSEAK